MSDRLFIVLACAGLLLHALAVALHWTALGMRVPLAAVTLLTAVAIIVVVLAAVRWRQGVFLAFIAGELLAGAAAAWALATDAPAALWCLGIAACSHALLMGALLAFLALFRMSRLF